MFPNSPMFPNGPGWTIQLRYWENHTKVSDYAPGTEILHMEEITPSTTHDFMLRVWLAIPLFHLVHPGYPPLWAPIR